MANTGFSFDDYITLKALKFKSDLYGRGNRNFTASLVEKDRALAESLGMKNMCFRVDPFTQARFEATIEALGMTKQEALMEAVEELLNRIDDKLTKIGLGPIGFEDRMRDLGFELGEPDADGDRPIQRIGANGKEGQ